MNEYDFVTLAAGMEKLTAGFRLLESLGMSVSSSQIYEDFFRQELLNEIRNENFKTNDVVLLTGSILGGSRELRVNAATLKLDLREFVVLLILGRKLKARTFDDFAPYSSFMPVKALLDEVGRVLQQEQIPTTQWRTPNEDDIPKVVFGLRKRIARLKGNPNLIESGQRGDGYRLSTPPRNLTLPLFPSIIRSAPFAKP